MARPNFEGDEAGRCGGCGSRKMLLSSDRQHAMCLECARLQEPEMRAWSEAEMCDNCAFRKGSPERADPYRWAEITAAVAENRFFHCHKGLAVTLSSDGLTATFSAPDPAEGRVTVCAGWLAARIALCRRAEQQK